MEYNSGKRAYVNIGLIFLNVLYFLYLEIAGSSEDILFMYEKGAMLAPAVLENGEYYRLPGIQNFRPASAHSKTKGSRCTFCIGPYRYGGRRM